MEETRQLINNNDIEETDTIAAIATPPGQGGIAIIRVTGPMARPILNKIFIPKKKNRPVISHKLMYGHIVKPDNNANEIIDEVMAVYMAAPNTYTKEDVAEIHTHGGSVAAHLVLSEILRSGARPAQPGEFTKRAFLNGRLDLSQAEAVMDMISANGAQAARVAARQLAGGASQFIESAQNDLYGLMAGLEAALDYPEEVEEEEAVFGLLEGLNAVAARLQDACDTRAVRLLHQGLSVVLSGSPNVGKSSLLNKLIGEDRAIVTDIPGTTRDVLTGVMELGGVPVYLNDTAGLRDSMEPVEKIGIERAQKAIREADLVLYLIDASQAIPPSELSLINNLINEKPMDVAIILNKGDLPAVITPEALRTALLGQNNGQNEKLPPELMDSINIFSISVYTGQGLDALKNYIKSKAEMPSETLLTNQRHINAARKAINALHQSILALKSGDSLELVAVDIREAMNALGEITGHQITERLLDNIFNAFCVGK